MKNFFTLLFVFFLYSAGATNYYFSSSTGDDSRTSAQARSASTPWKSLNKLNSFFSSLQPGDSVLLKRGETFYGYIIVSKSGTTSSPIVISAYGSGNKPLITSLVTLGGWVSKGNGIWESSNSSLGTTVNNVLLNGAVQQIGRYPNKDAANKGYMTIESYTKKSITDSKLSSSTNWKGAELVLRSRRWVIDRCPITNQSGHTITFTPSSSYVAKTGYGYFIQNDIRTLDQFGEWYYNPAAKKMSIFFGSAIPSSYTVQATSIDDLISAVSYSNVVFDNLTITGANANGFNIKNGSDMNIKNCDISFSGANGLLIKFHTNIDVENCTITNCNDNAINLGYSGDYATIRNNKIRNTSIFAGMGGSGDGKGFAIQSNGNGSVIEHNQIINTGYVGINFNGNGTVVKNNFIDSFCISKDDGSGIYTFTGDVNDNRTGRKVFGNIILNGVGAPEGINSPTRLAEGIYLDDNASGVEITGNTVANVPGHGIFLHNARNVIVTNNTLLNNGAQLYIAHDTKGSPVRNCAITNNIFFLQSASQKSITITSILNDINLTGKIDSNHYARPSDKNNSSFLSKVRQFEAKAAVINYTAPVIFDYNPLLQNNTFSLTGSYTDTKNNKYSNSIVLQAFSSAVLIKTGSDPISTPPQVSITSPAANTNFTSPGAIVITADATDDGSVSKVEFYNGSTLLKAQSSKPYSYSWLNVPAGNYTLTAKATDNDGNTTTSASVTVSVSATIGAPKVSLTSPSQNATYNSGATVNISADASADYGSIKKVEFYNGTTLLHTEKTSPYIWSWKNVLAGNYTLTAKATDNNGIATTSAAISIAVSAPANKYPAVSLTSPSQNAAYNSGATVTISADATADYGAISRVEFYNGTTLLHTLTASPYTWDWKNVAAGNYTITAKAIDSNGRATTSASAAISVTAIVTGFPVVSLTSPTQSASYDKGTTIVVTAVASVATGWITKVEFYNGTTLIHTETGRPYTWNWKNVAAGTYTITAKAIDNKGRATTSAGVTISVVAKKANRSIANDNAAKLPAYDYDNNVKYSMKVFPNPAVNIIQINIDGLQSSGQKANLTIQNLSGIMLKNIPVILSGNTIEADVTSLTTGMYILNIVSENFTINKKFIKN